MDLLLFVCGTDILCNLWQAEQTGGSYVCSFVDSRGRRRDGWLTIIHTCRTLVRRGNGHYQSIVGVVEGDSVLTAMRCGDRSVGKVRTGLAFVILDRFAGVAMILDNDFYHK